MMSHPKETPAQRVRRKIAQLNQEVHGRKDDQLNWHNLEHLFRDGGSAATHENARRKK